MKSGPQRYPGASTAYWYQSKFGGDSMESNVVVWHTTEGTSLPDYSGGAVAPNLTARPNFAAKRLEWFQHFDFDTSSRALVNKAGGVQTNTLNVCQIELVGTSDPSTHGRWAKAGYAHLYTPELPDWAIRDLAAFAKWAHDNHGVPLSSGLTFKAYPGSYGSGNGVRMSYAQWNSFKGHCGHQHVPENDHGDPGAFPMAAILAVAKNGTTDPEDDVSLTATQAKQLAELHDALLPYMGWDYKGKGKQDAWALLNTLSTQVAAQSAAISKLAQLVGSNVDTGQVVAAVEKAISDAVVKVDVNVTGTQGA